MFSGREDGVGEKGAEIAEFCSLLRSPNSEGMQVMGKIPLTKMMANSGLVWGQVRSFKTDHRKRDS